jgi:hypothetical protein
VTQAQSDGWPRSSSHSWALPAAAGLAAFEVTALIGVQAFAGHRNAPLIIALLAVKYPFCWAATQRRPGAYLALWLWEASGAVAALAVPGLGVVPRVLELGAALSCLGLLAASASLFPSPRLPGR